MHHTIDNHKDEQKHQTLIYAEVSNKHIPTNPGIVVVRGVLPAVKLEGMEVLISEGFALPQCPNYPTNRVEAYMSVEVPRNTRMAIAILAQVWSKVHSLTKRQSEKTPSIEQLHCSSVCNRRRKNQIHCSTIFRCIEYSIGIAGGILLPRQ